MKLGKASGETAGENIIHPCPYSLSIDAPPSKKIDKYRLR